MNEYRFTGNSQKASKFLLKQIPELQFSTLQKLFRKGEIKINNKKIYKDIILQPNDDVKVYLKAFVFDPTIIYEDDNIIVFYKNAKVASVGNNSFSEKVSQFINKDYVICHRLDTNTTGLVLFAKNQKIADLIRESFKKHEITKYYLACVNGVIDKNLTLKGYLKKDSKIGKVFIYDKQVANSQEIITKIKPLKICDEYSFVEVELVNGKTHQIRAHLSSVGHSIVGDSKYGIQSKNRAYNKRYQMLMAYKLKMNFSNSHLAYLNDINISLEETKL